MDKKKFFVGLAAIFAAVVFNINIGLRSESISGIALANIEALAGGEGSDGCTCISYVFNYYYHGCYYDGCRCSDGHLALGLPTSCLATP